MNYALNELAVAGVFDDIGGAIVNVAKKTVGVADKALSTVASAVPGGKQIVYLTPLGPTQYAVDEAKKVVKASKSLDSLVANSAKAIMANTAIASNLGHPGSIEGMNALVAAGKALNLTGKGAGISPEAILRAIQAKLPIDLDGRVQAKPMLSRTKSPAQIAKEAADRAAWEALAKLSPADQAKLYAQKQALTQLAKLSPADQAKLVATAAQNAATKPTTSAPVIDPKAAPGMTGLGGILVNPSLISYGNWKHAVSGGTSGIVITQGGITFGSWTQ